MQFPHKKPAPSPMKTSKNPENGHPISAKQTWAGLARELNVTDRSLRTWRAMPDAPQGPDVDAWKAFMAAEGLGQHKQAKGELADLRAQLLREQILRARRQNEKEAGELVAMADLLPYLRGRSARFASLARFTLEQELPTKLIGLPIAELRLEIRTALDRLVDRFNDGTSAGEIIAAATGQDNTGEIDAGRHL
jgi:hypothetical protein